MRRIDDSSRIMGLIGLAVTSGLVVAGFANASGNANRPPAALASPLARPASEAAAQPARQVRVVYGGPFTSAPAPGPRPAAPAPVAVGDPAPARAAVEPTAAPAPIRVASRDEGVLPSAETNALAGAKAGLDLNTASIEELNAIGAGRIGKAIARGRPYASPDDLLAKRVLNRAAFARIKDQVTVR